MTIARSSTCDLESRHCPAAARHQELGTPRDRRDMDIGTAVHHLVFAITMRSEDELADEVIDRTTADLVANGRSFDAGPVEHLRMEHVDRARDLALNFLDRDVLPKRDDGWMEAEVLVSVDRFFKRVDRDTCQCGHSEALDHAVAGLSHRGCVVGGCPCVGFLPVAIWQQAIDLAVIYQDEIDEEEVKVIEETDYKGGNCGNGWFTSLQGKAAAVSAVALCPDADIVRRRVISYMSWGGSYTHDLDLRQQEDVDTLEDYQRAVVVAARGHTGRQGKTPDELAQPGNGCSAGFMGCPWLMVCKPAGKQWSAVLSAWQHLGTTAPVTPRDTKTWASMYALAHAIKQESGKRIRAAMVDTDLVITVDGLSVVGWRQKAGTKIAPNAAMLLSEQWVEALLRLKKGSAEAQLEQARFEAFLLNLPKKGGVSFVKSLVKRLKDVIGYEEASALETLCLEDDSGRQLKVWKKPAPTMELMGALKESIEAGPPAPSSDAVAERKRDHDEKTDALLNDALTKSIEEKS